MSWSVRLTRATVRLLNCRNHLVSSASAPSSILNLPSSATQQVMGASSSKRSSAAPDNEFTKMTDAEWKKKLTADQYRVLRQKGTEKAFTGEYYQKKDDGIYACGACGAALFDSKAKFDSGSGWPSFFDRLKRGDNIDTVILRTDKTHGMERTEVVCAQCESHLGHVFDDGPTPTKQRYCINSCALNFKPKPEETMAVTE